MKPWHVVAHGGLAFVISITPSDVKGTRAAKLKELVVWYEGEERLGVKWQRQQRGPESVEVLTSCRTDGRIPPRSVESWLV